MIKPNKKIKAICFFILTLCVVQISKGQAIIHKNDFNADNTDSFVIKEFSGKQINNIVYFKFLIIENEPNVYYSIQSSINGVDFTTIYKKEGQISPQQVPLLYCCKMSVDNLRGTIFRISREREGDKHCTQPIFIETNKQMALTSK